MAGMTPIVTPLAASGFGPRALSLLGDRLRPLGMAPMSGGAAPERIVREEGDRPLVPGSPLSIAMVTGDFDLSGIGTVTHVEGDRVYGFGHPMFSLGACEFPMMTGYIHTVYPRASVSMKMGSPLKVVGVIDTDVSTSVAGRIGPKPDMLPLAVRVKTSQFADAHTYRVQMVREPVLLPNLIMAVLTNAIDTEGNLPEELTAQLSATIRLKGHEPITVSDTFSGPRYTGQMGAAALFSPLASMVNILVRNSMAPVRIESIDCDVQIEPGRKVAQIETVRLLSDTVEPGHDLKAIVTLKPFKGDRETVEVSIPIADDFPEGPCEAVFCDAANSIRRTLRNEPARSRAARPGRVDPDDPPADRAQADGRLCPRPFARARAVGPGAAVAQLAGQRAGRLCLQAGRADGADPHRHDPRGGDATGSSRECSRFALRWPRMPGYRYRIVERFGLCPTQRPRGTKCAILRVRAWVRRLSRLACAAVDRAWPRHVGDAARAWPRLKPGGRRARRPLPSATAKGS